MTRTRSPRTRSTARQPDVLDASHPGARRVPAANRSLSAALSMTLLAPLAVFVVAYPLAASAALVALTALAALGRRTARRHAGRRASIAVPGFDLRVEVTLAER